MHRVGVLGELVTPPKRLSPSRAKGAPGTFIQANIRLPSRHRPQRTGAPAPRFPPQHQLRGSAPPQPGGAHTATAMPTHGPSHRTGPQAPRSLPICWRRGVGGPYYLPLRPSPHLWKVGRSSSYQQPRVPMLQMGSLRPRGHRPPLPAAVFRTMEDMEPPANPWPFGGPRSASPGSGSSRGAPSSALWRSWGAPGRVQFSDTRRRRGCLCPHHRACEGGQEGPWSSARSRMRSECPWESWSAGGWDPGEAWSVGWVSGSFQVTGPAPWLHS